MATYLIKNDFTITRQEGDIADIVFVVQDTLLISGMTVKFQVFKSRTVVIDKVSPTTITVVGQTITIPLLQADTQDLKGTLTWELELTSTGKRITIGKGNFVIVNTDIA